MCSGADRMSNQKVNLSAPYSNFELILKTNLYFKMIAVAYCGHPIVILAYGTESCCIIKNDD